MKHPQADQLFPTNQAAVPEGTACGLQGSGGGGRDVECGSRGQVEG